jgi:hypothetical protein
MKRASVLIVIALVAAVAARAQVTRSATAPGASTRRAHGAPTRYKGFAGGRCGRLRPSP